MLVEEALGVSMEEAASYPWTTTSELALFQILTRTKPAGINKHFSMAIVMEELGASLGEDCQVSQVPGGQVPGGQVSQVPGGQVPGGQVSLVPRGQVSQVAR